MFLLVLGRGHFSVCACFRLAYRQAQIADLADEPAAVFRFHRDKLDGNPALLLVAPHNATPTNLSHRHIQQDLHQAAYGYFLFGSQENPAEREAIHVGNIPLHSGPPRTQHTRRRLDPWVGPLFDDTHGPRPYSVRQSTVGWGLRPDKLQSNSRLGGVCWGPTRPVAMSALK
jgi:hypothetical protein